MAPKRLTVGHRACAVAVVVAVVVVVASDVAVPSSSPLFCRRCSLVVAAPVAASFADPVAVPPLRVPWTFGILGSLGMPFRRGRHLTRVSRPIGSPFRHTPGRMRYSVPGGRIRPKGLPTPQDTPPVAIAARLQTPEWILLRRIYGRPEVLASRLL